MFFREKKHRCDKCNRSFPFHFKLKKHLKVCTGPKNLDFKDDLKEKEFRCEKCSKMFRFKSMLDKHTKICDGILRTRVKGSGGINYKCIMTNEGKQFQCKKCEETFSERSKFHAHYRVHLEKKYKCEKCGKMFEYKSILDYHLIKCDGILRIRPRFYRTGNFSEQEDLWVSCPLGELDKM